MKDISYMFDWATHFNQNLEKWNLRSDVKHTDVIKTEKKDYMCDISLKNYCSLRNNVKGDIGWDSTKCYYAHNYGGECSNDTWKTSVSEALKYLIQIDEFKNLTENEVTCYMFRKYVEEFKDKCQECDPKDADC